MQPSRVCCCCVQATQHVLRTSFPCSQRRYSGAYNAQLEVLQPVLAAISALPPGDELHNCYSTNALVLGILPRIPQAACLLDSDEWMARIRHALDVVADVSMALRSACVRRAASATGWAWPHCRVPMAPTLRPLILASGLASSPWLPAGGEPAA